MSPSLQNNRATRILKFQSRLLEELAFTEDSLQNPTNPISNIAGAVRDVVDAYFIYTYNTYDDGEYLLHFFWCGTPSAAWREAALHTVREEIRTQGSLASASDFTAVNTIASPAAVLPDIDKNLIEIRSKIFSLKKPDSIASAGIGLRKDCVKHAEEELVINNILVAVMNSAASAQTFAAYTREIEHFATRDPLTDLYNQIAFWDLLNYETERSRRQDYKFSLLVMDLDNFKTVNDRYGHDGGDAVLKQFAAVLKTAVRAGDITARYAGDEFTVILPVCDEAQANVAARRILESVREHLFKLEIDSTVTQTVSIGVAVFPDHAIEARDLYLLAGSMLRQAKTFGKDRLSMPSEHDNVEVLKSMSDKNIMILEALSRRKIIPYFQPIVNMKDMKIAAHEVLTRIVTNDRVIPASEFIEAAEGMGVIGKIDYQLIELTFAKVMECGYRGDLFLNLSPKALILNEFMPTVRKLLRDYNIEPSKMVFEITERDTVKALNVIEKFIGELKSDGFRFAIDDFGAGYSSFQYITKFSVDFIKIDGEFVKHMNGNRLVEKAIVSSIVALSEILGIKTIAEFVETEGLLSVVKAAGIQYGQGYHIKRPSPDLVT